MSRDPIARREPIAHVFAALAGVAFVVLGSKVFPLLGGRLPFLAVLLASNLLMSAIGIGIGRYTPAAAYSTTGLVTFAGICAGVLMAASYDVSVRGVDHNLVPFEFVVNCLLFIPGVLAGLAIAKDSK